MAGLPGSKLPAAALTAVIVIVCLRSGRLNTATMFALAATVVVLLMLPCGQIGPGRSGS